MTLDSNQIQAIIPHRYPFLLIDRVIDLKPGTSAKAIKNVSINEPYFQGHFPRTSVMPGVLIVEALSQTGAVALLSMEENVGKLAFFAGIDNCKFKHTVVPGDQLILEAHIVRKKLNLGVAEATARVGEKTVCKATIKFVVHKE